MHKHTLRDFSALKQRTVPMAVRNSDKRRQRRENIISALLFVLAVCSFLFLYGIVGQMDYEDALQLERKLAVHTMPANANPDF